MTTHQLKGYITRPDKYDFCPECGEYKSKVSKLCLRCRKKYQRGSEGSNWRGGQPKCPNCGGLKSRDKKNSPIILCDKCAGFTGRPWWENKALSPWNKGKLRDLITKIKIAQTVNAQFAAGERQATSGAFKKGHKMTDEQTKKAFLNRVVKPNKKERFLIQLLQSTNLPYDFVGDGKFIIDGKCPDFVNVNGQKKIIEIFGDYWHEPKEENERIALFAKFGFKTLIIWEHELKNITSLTQRLLQFNEA